MQNRLQIGMEGGNKGAEMVKLGKIKFHWSLFLLLILVTLFGKIKLFFLLVFVTTLHELSHVFAAKCFGLDFSEIIITPIGETAFIDRFDAISASKKYIILAAGPLVNIISFFFILLIFGQNGGELSEAANVSLAIGLFNLLPVFPLDGGRLLFIFLGNRLGILKSIDYIKGITKAGIFILFLAGFVQLILFPLNISLIAIGIFFASIFEMEKTSMLFSYYKCMLNKGGRLKAGIPAKSAVFSGETTTDEAERIFTWDYFHIAHVEKGGEIIGTLTEKQVFEASLARSPGVTIKLLDILVDSAIIVNGESE